MHDSAAHMRRSVVVAPRAHMNDFLPYTGNVIKRQDGEHDRRKSNRPSRSPARIKKAGVDRTGSL
jgi:hypothetical protein